MFQECLIVLRSIVLQSLGITLQSSPDSRQYATAQSLSSQISSQPQAKPSVAASEDTCNDSSPNKRHQAIKVSPRNQLGHVFTTPSPNSRISSGFGSLQDEDGSINYESSYDQKNSHTRVLSDSPPQYLPGQKDPNLIKIEHRSRERERKRRRHHKHHRWSTHDKVSAERDPSHTTLSPKYEQNGAAGVQSRDSNSNPPPPRGAWDVPVTSPTNHSTTSPRIQQSVRSSLDNQTFPSPRQNPASCIETSTLTDIESECRNVPVSGGSEAKGNEDSVQSPPHAKVLSPRAEKQRQKLHSKQVELRKSKEEKERLVNEVNLLNLKVLEEGTK